MTLISIKARRARSFCDMRFMNCIAAAVGSGQCLAVHFAFYPLQPGLALTMLTLQRRELFAQRFVGEKRENLRPFVNWSLRSGLAQHGHPPFRERLQCP